MSVPIGNRMLWISDFHAHHFSGKTVQSCSHSLHKYEVYALLFILIQVGDTAHLSFEGFCTRVSVCCHCARTIKQGGVCLLHCFTFRNLFFFYGIFFFLFLLRNLILPQIEDRNYMPEKICSVWWTFSHSLSIHCSLCVLIMAYIMPWLRSDSLALFCSKVTTKSLQFDVWKMLVHVCDVMIANYSISLHTIYLYAWVPWWNISYRQIYLRLFRVK